MNLTPWKLWTPDGKPAANTEQIVTRARVGAAAQSESSRREPLLHSRRRGLAHAGARAAERAASDDARRIIGASAPHAGAHLRAHGRPCRRRGGECGGRGGRSPLSRRPRRPNGMYGMMYYPHNLHFLADSHMMQGRFADAKQAADRVAEQLESARRHDADGRIDGRHAGVGPHAVLEARRCARAAGAAGGAPRAARMASLRARDGARQNRQSRRSRGRTKAADDGHRGRSRNGGVRRRRVGDGGERAERRGALARRAHRSARAASTIAPSNSGSRRSRRPINFPTTSRRCGSIRCASRWARRCSPRGARADAERVFRDDLVKHPRNARSLFGLQAALAKQGKDADAAWVQREFDEAWKNADTKLTLEMF